MGSRNWAPTKMGPLSSKCFDFFLISTMGPFAGSISWTPFWAQFLDPILGPVSGPHFGVHFLDPFSGPHNGSKKQKFLLCVANIFGSKEAENHVYCADLMVTLKRVDEYNARMLRCYIKILTLHQMQVLWTLQKRNRIPDWGGPLPSHGFLWQKMTPILGPLKLMSFKL